MKFIEQQRIVSDDSFFPLQIIKYTQDESHIDYRPLMDDSAEYFIHYYNSLRRYLMLSSIRLGYFPFINHQHDQHNYNINTEILIQALKRINGIYGFCILPPNDLYVFIGGPFLRYSYITNVINYYLQHPSLGWSFQKDFVLPYTQRSYSSGDNINHVIMTSKRFTKDFFDYTIHINEYDINHNNYQYLTRRGKLFCRLMKTFFAQDCLNYERNIVNKIESICISGYNIFIKYRRITDATRIASELNVLNLLVEKTLNKDRDLSIFIINAPQNIYSLYNMLDVTLNEQYRTLFDYERTSLPQHETMHIHHRRPTAAGEQNNRNISYYNNWDSYNNILNTQRRINPNQLYGRMGIDSDVSSSMRDITDDGRIIMADTSTMGDITESSRNFLRDMLRERGEDSIRSWGQFFNNRFFIENNDDDD